VTPTGTPTVVAWLFLAVSLYGAVYTLNAYRPARRGRARFVWGFVSSVVTIEAAPWHVVWQVAATGVFVWLGALSSWPGWVGLAVCVVSWAGLLWLYAQGRATTHAVNAMLEEVGTDVVMVRAARRLVRHTRNVEFGRAGGRRLRLDVFEPVAPCPPGQRRPAIVQIHGGGWVLGFKERQAVPLMRHLASNGWVVFNVDYRLSPAATWPDHLIDCKAAVAWVRQHADDYGVDPTFVAVTGGSAGGHLTAMLALTANDPRYQPGFVDADTSLQAAVPFYAVYDWTNRSGAFGPELQRDILEPLVVKAFMADAPELFEDASPLVLLDDAEQHHTMLNVAPMLIVHGERDTLAPVDDARTFARRLAAVSTNEVRYLELPGTQHAFDAFRSPRTDAVVRAVHRFVEHVWRQHCAAQAREEAPVPAPQVD